MDSDTEPLPMPIATVNPTTGELLRTFEPLTGAQIEEKLRLAAEEYPRFRKLSFAQRAVMMNKAAAILEAEKEELGRIMTTEMGQNAPIGHRRGRQVRLGAARLLRRERWSSSLAPGRRRRLPGS